MLPWIPARLHAGRLAGTGTGTGKHAEPCRISLATPRARQTPRRANMVSMTSSSDRSAPNPNAARTPRPAGAWRLQDAKAQFSELVRRATRDGPQHVTVHGRDAVVVVGADEFRRLKGARSGQSLVDALQASPFPEISLEPDRQAMPVRDVVL